MWWSYPLTADPLPSSGRLGGPGSSTGSSLTAAIRKGMVYQDASVCTRLFVRELPTIARIRVHVMKTRQVVLYLAFVFKSKDGAAPSVQKLLLLLTGKCSECRN